MTDGQLGSLFEAFTYYCFIALTSVFLMLFPPFSQPIYAVSEENLSSAETLSSESTELSQEIKDLDGKRFGVQSGSTFDKDVQSWFPHSAILYYNSLPDLAVALKTGKIDAFPTDAITLEMMNDQGTELRALDQYMDKYSCGVVFQKDPEGEKLRDEMDAWLNEKKKSGALDNILDKWLHAEEEEKSMPDYKSLPAENGVLTFATEAGFPPFNYIRSGEVVGYEVEMAISFCADYGYGIEIIPMNFEGILPALQSKKIDFAASGIAITPERMESINFTQPYYTGGTRIVVRNNNSSGESSFFKSISESFIKTFVKDDRWQLFLTGICNTLLITLLSIFGGTAFGFLIFMLCRNGNVIANSITRLCLWLVQGMPIVVLLMILYYIIFGRVSISGIAVAVIGFTLSFGAAVFGLLKMGVGAVDNGQYEAAYALGYSDRRTFFRIILPQALPHVMPAYKGEIVSLIKATAVVGYIAVQDLTKMGDIVRSRTYEAFFPLIAVTVIYFVLESLIGFIVSRISIHFNPKRRKPADILKGVKCDD